MSKQDDVLLAMNGIRTFYSNPRSTVSTCGNCFSHDSINEKLCPYCNEEVLADHVGDDLAGEFHTAMSDSYDAVVSIEGVIGNG